MMKAEQRKILIPSVIALLFAILIVYLYVQKNRTEKQLSATQLEYQEMRKSYSDSLAYYTLIAQASYQLLNQNYDEAVELYSSAEQRLDNPTRWTTVANTLIQLQALSKDTINNLMGQSFTMGKKILEYENTIQSLMHEIQERKSETDSARNQMLETVLALNKALVKNQELQGQIYELKSAYGKISFVNSEGRDINYFGEIKNGMANGFGIGIVDSKGLYEGYWKNNLRHGKGKYKWANGDIYEGDFVEGKKSGKGIYIFQTGERYEGDWQNDVREGKGVIYAKDGKVMIDAIWKGDKIEKNNKVELSNNN